MALPPFPAQDLAKLVLGYLMEEQLMTAYDEFLQASPYLDAFTNEYDRLCMLSLKNILAEYRAMRLLVETSKPIALRRKLLQCTNLTEMLKLLVLNVDLKKLCENDAELEKYRIRTSLPLNKTRDNSNESLHSRISDAHQTTNMEVDTTPLADLPGNNANMKNNISGIQQLYPRQLVRSDSGNSTTNTQFTTSPSKRQPQSATRILHNHGKPLSCNFNDFASGAGGDTNCVVSDCSNFENINVKLDHPKSGNLTNIFLSGSSGTNLSQQPMNTAPTNNTVEDRSTNKTQYSKDNQKITILSNIKVDNNRLSGTKITEHQPSLLQKTQTIYINGTPVYKSDPEISNKFTFTKDEIMAMPTVILVPTGAGNDAVDSVQVPPPVPLNPLTINVPVSMPTIDITNEPESIAAPQETPQSNKLLLKTADKICSLPPTCQFVEKLSTPKMSRPLRKSSSTPRRSSHIRVLDFNTPRRILDGPILENTRDEIETVVSKSPNMNLEIGKPVEQIKNTKGENVEHPKKKRKSWDEDLRSKIFQDDINLTTPKSSKKDRKRPENEKKHPRKNKDSSNKKNTKTKQNKTRKQSCTDKIEDPPDKLNVSESPVPVEIPIKPTINIISDTTTKENIRLDPETGDSFREPPVLTPENETTYLQHAIGARLNISDFLETPFKQALFDIQMDTPKFLGPDIGGEPVSDIKITNIPTPTFLTRPSQNISPYPSRSTDYSSGGSYYKPDDNDCPNLLDDIDINSKIKVLTPATDSVNVDEKTKTTSKKRLSSRPIRQCTKNVSYYNSPFANKVKSPRRSHSNDSKESEGSEDIKDNEEVRDKIEIKEKRKSTSRGTPKIKAKLKSLYIKSPLKENINKHKKIPNRKRTNSKDKDFITPIIEPRPTKSRRKSSTPRKLHCTKAINDSAEMKITYRTVHEKSVKWNTVNYVESNSNASMTEVEDITKIREFIEKTQSTKMVTEESSNEVVKVHIIESDSKGLHADLIKRGFDAEVAKTIERDLTEFSPKHAEESNIGKSMANFYNEIDKETEPVKAVHVSSDLDAEEETEDLEFSVHECNEKSSNYTSIEHNEGLEYRNNVTFKNDFTMDICMEDIVIRLKATPLTDLFTEEPKQIELRDVVEDNLETEAAVRSISYIDKLYTPRKVMTDEEQAKCREIFNSSLLSLDTPMKVTSPRCEEEKKEVSRKFSVTEVTLEIEPIDEQQTSPKESSSVKRKRLRSGSSSDDTSSVSKKSKPQYLKNIQNFDIESVLSKLHGP